ncbi:MAG TPA: transglutaminase family protein [Polyangiales bacterium]|nr:transglutaminase family protein [Polyangiales bacterium]
MIRAALVCLCLAACAQPTAAPATPLTEALLAHARTWSGADLSEFARAELDRIAARIRALHSREPASSMHTLLRRVVFAEFKFVREVDDLSLRFVFLPSVLQTHRGSCVGLGTLYLALGERLGLDLHGVLVPGHFFVRLREHGQLRNIELLREGQELPEAWYRERWPITTGSRAYARALRAAEVEAVVLFDVGNDRRRSGAYGQAERAFSLAAERFPEFAEAQASAGTMAHLLGALDRARAAYAAARAADPSLEGLDENVALLQAEVSGSQ